MATLKKIYKWYCRIEMLLACAAFFTIIALTFANAVLRALNHPIVSNDDLCTLLFAWVSFMGADIAMRSNRLVGMDLVTMNLPAKLQKVLQLIVYLIMGATLVMLAVQGYKLAVMNWSRFFNTLPVSYGLVTLSLAVCGVQMLITLCIKFVVVVQHFGDDSFSIKQHDPDKEGKEAQQA